MPLYSSMPLHCILVLLLNETQKTYLKDIIIDIGVESCSHVLGCCSNFRIFLARDWWEQTNLILKAMTRNPCYCAFESEAFCCVSDPNVTPVISGGIRPLGTHYEDQFLIRQNLLLLASVVWICFTRAAKRHCTKQTLALIALRFSSHACEHICKIKTCDIVLLWNFLWSGNSQPGPWNP